MQQFGEHPHQDRQVFARRGYPRMAYRILIASS